MTAYDLLMQTTGLQKQAASRFPRLSAYLEKKAAGKKKKKKDEDDEDEGTDWGRVAALALGGLGTGAGGYALYQALKNKGGIENLNTGVADLNSGMTGLNADIAGLHDGIAGINDGMGQLRGDMNAKYNAVRADLSKVDDKTKLNTATLIGHGLLDTAKAQRAFARDPKTARSLLNGAGAAQTNILSKLPSSNSLPALPPGMPTVG